jgi:DNA (cytosine-5)-methyltransferase 1
MKVLNLYAGIGGNRKLWENVDVTAIENNKEIAKIYQDFFPNDKVIITDAHQFLLEHFDRFDFIWSSPPCQTHSRSRFWGTNRGYRIVYPDMKLYEEILLLKHYFKGKWLVENVIGFYEPLIKPRKINRHYFWSNFNIPNIELPNLSKIINSLKKLEDYYGFRVSHYKIDIDKRILLRNCVEPELGLHIFNMAFKDKQKTLMLKKQPHEKTRRSR